MKRLSVAILSAVGLTACWGQAAMVVERWGVAGRVQHPGTLVFERHAEQGTLMRFDLSALPAKAKVYRARLFVSRPGRYGSGFDITDAQRVGAGKDAKLKPVGRALALAPPHWRWFDATAAVGRALQAGQTDALLLLRKAPAFDQKATYLELAYEGPLRSAPRPVTGVQAAYRGGQVFITFKEIEDFARGKEKITWGELAGRFKTISYEGPLPRDEKGELRYRVYAHSKPITAATIGEARLLGEAVPGSIYNTRLVPGGDFMSRRSKALAGRLALPARPDDAKARPDPAKAKAPPPGPRLLPPGTGLYVHTVARPGEAYYAVVTAFNGVENTAALGRDNAVGPIKQGRAAPEPVLQSLRLTPIRNVGNYQERWYSYWAVPPQAPRPTRYDLAVGLCPARIAHPAPLTFTRGHTWGPGPEMPGPAGRRGIVMSMNTDPGNGLWTGINDARDTLKGIEQGTWKPFTHNRQEALIRWAQGRWEIDPQRITGSIGAWGMWEIKRADLYAYIHGWGMPEITKGFQCWAWARGAWGPPAAYADKGDDANPWVQQDYSRWVLAHPEKELPYFYIHTGWGAHFTEMGWPPFPRFVRAMIDTRRAFCMQAGAVGEAMRAGIIQLRRDRSVPAFGNCSLDDNIGEGDLRSGRPFGQINGYLVWESETLVDEPGLYQITVYLWPGGSRGRYAAPLDTCAVDLTPRKCQKFKPKPGEHFTWTSTTAADGKTVQTGHATADKLGLVTLKELLVTKAKRRIAIRRR